MIVRRDFLDHWKTRKLRELLGYDHVSDHLIALWAHCEQSKRWRFPDNAEQMANICRYQDGSPDDFCAALLKARFLDHINGEYVVHDWEEYNKKLIHNWTAGLKGGRPPSVSQWQGAQIQNRLERHHPEE